MSELGIQGLFNGSRGQQSLRALQKELGISHSTLHMIGQGMYTCISLEVAEKLSRFLGIDMNTLTALYKQDMRTRRKV